MIVWSGLGFLVAIIMFGVAILFQELLPKLFGYEASWMLGLGYMASAIPIWLVSKKISGKGRIVIDKETGKELVIGRSNSFFFIPIRYWPYLAIIIGLIVAGFSSGSQR